MEQSSLQQQGIMDPAEMEFSNVVRPIMESCTKDAIAVSVSVCLSVSVCQFICMFLFVHLEGWKELDL